MTDTDDHCALFALMSAVSSTTSINLVADADAKKHKSRPRRKHTVWIIEILLRGRECYGAYNSLMRDLLSLAVI